MRHSAASLSDDVMKCALKPPDRGDHSVAFTDDQWARLRKAFPTGVCDSTKPLRRRAATR